MSHTPHAPTPPTDRAQPLPPSGSTWIGPKALSQDPQREERRKEIRASLWHPYEIPWLAGAIIFNAAVLAWAVLEVVIAFGKGRDPNVYAGLLIAAPILIWFARGQIFARLRSNGVKVSPTQYPEAYAMVEDAANHYGLARIPDAYVVLGNGAINAAASGHGYRRFIFIYSDLFEVGGRTRDPDALAFIIGHEVGHIAAGHTSYWRLLATFGSQFIPFVGSTLSRTQEYTADNFGYSYRAHGSPGAIGTLAGGKYLNRTVDVNALADRAETEKGFFVWLGNATSTHPVLTWRAHALRDRSQPGRILLRPHRSGWTAPEPAPRVDA
ncbi:MULTISPECIES: M48 family metallopeptidase [unclassified Janibacter]|uniref:M48 family metallopeptidase n=1 Tax=unclassified Janibacter TaxID=2649294 RepID=UPI003D04D8EE